MANGHLKIGELGEDLAVEVLKDKDYKIMERNAENKFGEIDIVAAKDNVVVFVEVRSKIGKDFGLPEETIGFHKKRKLIKNAKRYIKLNNIENPYRIDVIGIVFSKNREVLRKKHYKNITLN